MDELWRDTKQPKLLNARDEEGDIRYQSLEVRLDCART